MPYSADAIANAFLDTAWAQDKSLTPMQVQKLVYYAHGWSLALTDNALIREPIQAWKFGPVIQSLYREFKEFGDVPVSRKAIELRYVPTLDLGFDEVEQYEPSIDEENRAEGNTPDANTAKAIVGRVFRLYGHYSGSELSSMTHREGTPWRTVLSKFRGAIPMGVNIPNALIKSHFRAELSKALKP